MSLQKLTIWFFLIFIFLECTEKIFLIKIPNLPYSLATVFFMLIGFFSFPKLKTALKYRLVILMAIIYLSNIIAALLSDYSLQDNLSPAIGAFLTFLGSVGFAFFLYRSNWLRILDVYFLFTLVYWSSYILSNTISEGTIVNYSEIEDIVNHHVSAFIVSLSGIYFIHRDKKSVLSVKNMLLFLFITAVIILSESRSNLVVFILTYAISFAYQKRAFIYSLIIATMVFLGMGYNLVFTKIFENEAISTRFDVTNTEYIEETNISRVLLYQEFIPTLLQNPYGKGAANPKVDTIFGEKLMHNKYASFIITGGFISLIFVIAMVIYLLKFNLSLRQKIINLERYHYFKSLTFVLICFYLTILSVDVGGLRYHLFFSFTLLLVLLDASEMDKFVTNIKIYEKTHPTK